MKSIVPVRNNEIEKTDEITDEIIEAEVYTEYDWYPEILRKFQEADAYVRRTGQSVNVNGNWFTPRGIARGEAKRRNAITGCVFWAVAIVAMLVIFFLIAPPV
jgi:hypothetical protein